MSTIIRVYLPKDRADIRRLSLNYFTERGLAPGWIDPKLLADWTTQYYTDCAPWSLWVAEENDRVLTYLAGCMNSVHSRWWQIRHLSLRLLGTSIARKALFQKETWHAIRRQLIHAFEGTEHFAMENYPAHFRLTIEKDVSRNDLPKRLINEFCDQAAERGVRGVHTYIHSNDSFLHDVMMDLAFKPIGHVPAREKHGKERHYIVFGKLFTKKENGNP